MKLNLWWISSKENQTNDQRQWKVSHNATTFYQLLYNYCELYYNLSNRVMGKNLNFKWTFSAFAFVYRNTGLNNLQCAIQWSLCKRHSHIPISSLRIAILHRRVSSRAIRSSCNCAVLLCPPNTKAEKRFTIHQNTLHKDLCCNFIQNCNELQRQGLSIDIVQRCLRT